MTGTTFRSWVWWASALLVATLLSVLVATQNWISLAGAGRETPWVLLLALELPVWVSWALLMPAVAWMALRFPPVGRARLRNLALHLLAGLVLILLSIALVTAVRWGYQPPLPPGVGYVELVGVTYQRYFALFLIVYGSLVTAVLAWSYHVDSQARQVRASQLAAQLSEARLDALRRQIQPHFLFNTLHAISALMAQDVPGARRMMTRLSDLLRLALEEDGAHEVPLEEELRFLDRYADIQRMRFGDRLEIRYAVAPEVRGARVPRLLLQPLVENAIEHGVARRAGPGTVEVTATRSDGAVEIVVRDDGPGFGASAPVRPAGVGLRNTRSRLEQMYGDEAELSLGEMEGGGARVRIRIPYRPAGEPGGPLPGREPTP